MATVTPNYGWDVPTSTDYVAQGAVAIETLGDDIDATLFGITNGKNAGLSPIATTTFTAASSVSFSSIFTSAYDHYKIFLTITGASAANSVLLRLRSGGSDISSANYNRQEFTANSTTLTGAQGNAQTAFINAKYDSAGGFSETTLYNPFVANFTYMTSNAVTPTSTVTMLNTAGFFTLANSYNGCSLIAAGGVITGIARVYGIRNS